MPRVLRTLIPAAAVLLLGLVAGFYVFATSVGSYERQALPRADGIVVLTGGEDRISAGIALVAARQGKRLLISGVHPKIATPADFRRRLGGDQALLNCCVDLGHDALNTYGNAEEARLWAAARGYRSLIVVTSTYHMPRSMTEFSRSMPDMQLIPYPVPSRTLKLGAWWQHRPTARLLVGEYIKFLSSTARFGISRFIGSLQERARLAGDPPAGGRSI